MSTWIEEKSLSLFLFPCYTKHSSGSSVTNVYPFSSFSFIDGEYLFVDPENKLGKYAPKGWKSSHASVSIHIVEVTLVCFAAYKERDRVCVCVFGVKRVASNRSFVSIICYLREEKRLWCVEKGQMACPVPLGGTGPSFFFLFYWSLWVVHTSRVHLLERKLCGWDVATLSRYYIIAPSGGIGSSTFGLVPKWECERARPWPFVSVRTRLDKRWNAERAGSPDKSCRRLGISWNAVRYVH